MNLKLWQRFIPELVSLMVLIRQSPLHAQLIVMEHAVVEVFQLFLHLCEQVQVQVLVLFIVQDLDLFQIQNRVLRNH